MKNGKRSVQTTFAMAAALGGLLWCTVGLDSSANAAGMDKGTDNRWIEYTAEGKMNRPPVSFRKWVYVGTPVTPNDMNDGKANFPEFHNVYMDP